jgi:hypothetical protein
MAGSELEHTLLDLQRTEGGWRDAGLRGGLVGGGDPEGYILLAGLRAETSENGSPGGGSAIGVSDETRM